MLGTACHHEKMGACERKTEPTSSTPEGIGERYGEPLPKIPMFSRISFGFALLLACVGCGVGRPPSVTAGSDAGSDPLRRQTAASLFQRGRESADRGDTVRAEQYLELALDRGYERRQVLPLLLRVCLSSGRLRSALNYAEPELRARPDDAELRYLVASIHLGLGQHGQAHDELEQLLRLNPSHAAALYLLGVVEADDFEDAAAAMNHFQLYLLAAPNGKHAAEIRNRLSELDARHAIATNVASSNESRLPRYVPSPNVVKETMTPLPAASAQPSEGGAW